MAALEWGVKARFHPSVILLFALVPAQAMAAPPVDPYQFDLKVVPASGAALEADADLRAEFPQVETTLQLVVQADPKLANNDPLTQATPAAASRESLGLDAAWTAQARARLDLALSDQLDQTWAPAVLAVASDHQISTEVRSANVRLNLEPFSVLDLNLTGATAERTVVDTVVAQTAAPESQSQFATSTQSAGAGLKWRLARWFSLDAGGKLETANVQWRGSGLSGAAADAALAYAYFEPAVTGALSLPGQAKLGMTFERSVSPLDPGAFAAFAAADDGAAARFGPNREWRYRLSFDQTLADQIKVSAALTQAQIESATELGPVGAGLQAPVSVVGGERQQVDVSLSAPMTLLGLPSVSLNGAGTWRDSQVRDPFTGALRRASAESPQTAQIGIVQSLTDERARWGIEGRFGGDQSLYQMAQVTRVSVADSVGGFVEYAPGAFALRLQVDGLYGGDRTSTNLYYAGSRASGYVDRIDHRSDSGQAVRLVLRKSL